MTIWGTLSLGELIESLSRVNGGLSIMYDFCDVVPDGTIRSYRGSYDHLAVGWTEGVYDSVRVQDLLAEVKGAVGKTFEGYKGGNYLMTNETPVWVSNYGQSTSTAIIGVTEHADLCAIIDTQYVGV